MKISIGSDHRGIALKEAAGAYLRERGYDVTDRGSFDDQSADYPDFALKVSVDVSTGASGLGLLICGTGIGMSIAANKLPSVRAALVHDETTARFAKEHNNANVLVIGGNGRDAAGVTALLGTWLDARFEGGRHQCRLDKIAAIEEEMCRRHNVVDVIAQADPEMAMATANEMDRQRNTLILIASENYASKAVLAAQGSVFTNKYAEGYPGKRYYGGCEFSDVVERAAIERAKELFGAEHANVQPISGSAANLAAYFAVINPGDTVLSMKLAHGGHLTHGAPVSVTGKVFNMIHYGVARETGLIDYDEVERLAAQHRPKVILAGASSYSRHIDFARFRAIADSVGACFMVDMAHIAGLVAGKAHPSPVPYADIVMSTTHKTLRGPRGGFILCREQYRDRVDKAVFPGMQGGPLVHTVLAKAIAFKEAMSPEFAAYQRQVVTNASAMARVLKDEGFKIVSGGTDNHLFCLDFSGTDMTGKAAETLLEEIGITLNKNAVPFDERPPAQTSGVRIGTPFVTSRGIGEDQAVQIARMIASRLRNPADAALKDSLAASVRKMCGDFPLYQEIL